VSESSRLSPSAFELRDCRRVFASRDELFFRSSWKRSEEAGSCRRVESRAIGGARCEGRSIDCRTDRKSIIRNNVASWRICRENDTQFLLCFDEA